jgi:hypothetical protein
MNLHNNYDVTKYLEISKLSGLLHSQASPYTRFLDSAMPQGIRIATTPAVAFLFFVDYLA